MHWECIIIKDGKNYYFLCVITLYQESIYSEHLILYYITPLTDIVAPRCIKICTI